MAFVQDCPLFVRASTRSPANLLFDVDRGERGHNMHIMHIPRPEDAIGRAPVSHRDGLFT